MSNLQSELILTSEKLVALKGGEPIRGYILVKDYNIQLTKQQKEYVVGNLQSGQTIMQFKAWNGSTAFTKLKSEEYSGSVVLLTGNADNYGGTVSIVATDVTAIEVDDVSDFLPRKYDINVYWEALKNLVYGAVTKKGKEVVNKILFENDEVANVFKKEYAASSHHDNCLGGLLAHTYKVVVNVLSVINMYPIFIRTTDDKDLLVIGACLHDIGKTRELKLGTYQRESFTTHRYLGIEMLDKDLIVSKYDEDWWLRLVSIMLQHHNEFDDRCRTIDAFIIYKCDYMESALCLIAQQLETPVTDGAGAKVKYDGKWLVR